MKKKLLAALAWVLLAGVAILFPLSSAHAVQVYRYESGANYWDQTKATPGYILFSSAAGAGAGTSATAYLLDPMGRICHTWPGVGDAARLQEDGSVSTCGRLNSMDNTTRFAWSAPNSPSTTRTENGVTTTRGSYSLNAHHDGMRIWNKKLQQFTYLVAINYTVNTEDQYAAGYGHVTSTQGSLDGVAELNEAKQLVWEWRFMDHTYQTRYPEYPRYIAPVAPGEAGYLDYLAKTYKGGFDVYWQPDSDRPDGTAGGIIGDWQHINAIDYDDEKDIVVINCKEFSENIFIDHGATFTSTSDWSVNIANSARNQFSDDKIANPALPDGDLVYRWGHPSNYGAGTQGSFAHDGTTMMFGPHCCTINQSYAWRPYRATTSSTQAGYVGTWANPTNDNKMTNGGGWVVYDNGCYKTTGSRSVIHEIDPFLDASRNDTCTDRTDRQNCAYVPEYLAGWYDTHNGVQMSKQTVMRFEAKLSNSFYSSHISGTAKLPDGNYITTAGNRGHMFQHTPEGEVVWDYCRATTEIVTAGTQTFRSYWYMPDHPGIVALLAYHGGDFTPGADLAGRTGDDFTYKLVGSGGPDCVGADACCVGTTCPVCPDCEGLGQCTSENCCETPPLCDCDECECETCCDNPDVCVCEVCECLTCCDTLPTCTDCPECPDPQCEECTPSSDCPGCECETCCDNPPVCTDCPEECECETCCDTPPLCDCDDCACETCCGDLTLCTCEQCDCTEDDCVCPHECLDCDDECPACDSVYDSVTNPDGWLGQCCEETPCSHYDSMETYCVEMGLVTDIESQCNCTGGGTGTVEPINGVCPTCAPCSSTAGKAEVDVNGETIYVKPAISRGWGVGVTTSSGGSGDGGSGSGGSSGGY